MSFRIPHKCEKKFLGIYLKIRVSRERDKYNWWQHISVQVLSEERLWSLRVGKYSRRKKPSNLEYEIRCTSILKSLKSRRHANGSSLSDLHALPRNRKFTKSVRSVCVKSSCTFNYKLKQKWLHIQILKETRERNTRRYEVRIRIPWQTRNEVFARCAACFRRKRQLSVTNEFDWLTLSLHAIYRPIATRAEFAAISGLVVYENRARV